MKKKNNKKTSKSLTPNAVVIIDVDEYKKMKKQLEVVRNKIMPLIHITGRYEGGGKTSYRATYYDMPEYKNITEKEYDLLLDLKRGNKNEQTKE